MRLDESFTFRRPIVPWYDADGVCIATAVFMTAVLGFGAVGVAVARRVPAFHDHLWVPLALVAGSALVILTTTVRLFRRRRGRRR